ncbi:MAG: type II secretion system protein GspN [Syntrophaceae bacterium]|nr:type II secretion system protein GspN [Syntrophaceae bacterium]
MKGAFRTYAGYAAFAVAALLVIAWVKMPPDTLRLLVLSALSKNKAGMQVRLDAAEWAFPVGLALTGLSVRPKDGRGPEVRADRLTARPALTALAAGRLAFRVEASAMGGRIDGDIAVRNRFSASGPVQADLQFSGIDAAGCPWLAELLGRSLRGRVEGRLRFEGLPERWPDGAGRLEIVLTDGQIAFKAPLFGLQEMTVAKMEGDMDLGSGVVKVNRLRVTGDQLEGDFRGSIRIAGDLPASRIALRGDVTIPAVGPERFAVEVSGTVASPVVTPL